LYPGPNIWISEAILERAFAAANQTLTVLKAPTIALGAIAVWYPARKRQISF
jgi:hypothetical protein